MIKFVRTLNFIKNTTNLQSIVIQNCRTLYSSGALGIDGYISTRDKIKNQFLNNEIKFREKMKEYIENKSNMIFTDDLRNMVHIADKTDIDLVIRMIEKFHSQNKEIRFGNYVFGPVVMRMFYYLGDVDSALKCFSQANLNGFFSQPSSIQILLDMLYENKRYNEILELFNSLKSNPEMNVNSLKHVVTLVFAACYKLNTTESFKHCLEIWHELHEKGFKTMRKTATFAAGLALKQNSSHIALEIVSTLKEQQYLTVRNIKAQAYADLDRPEDSLPILRSILEIDDAVGTGASGSTKQTFIRDVINKIQESIQRNHKQDLEKDFNRIVKFLDENGHITDQTMDDILCLEISKTAVNSPRKDQGYMAATFSRDKFYTRSGRNAPTRRRQTLQDLY